MIEIVASSAEIDGRPVVLDRADAVVRDLFANKLEQVVVPHPKQP